MLSTNGIRTWPTTYRLITAIRGGLDTISSRTDLEVATCAHAVTAVDLPATTEYSRFIFDNNDFVVQKTVPTALLNYLNAQPTVSEVFPGKDLKQCSTFIGTDTFSRTASSLGEFTTTPSVRPATHTTVSVLTVMVAPSTTTISGTASKSAPTPIAAPPASQVAPTLSMTDSPGPQQSLDTPPTADQNAPPTNDQNPPPGDNQTPAPTSVSPMQSGFPAQSEGFPQQSSGISQETLSAVNIGGVLGSLLGDIGASITTPAVPAQTPVNNSPSPTPSPDTGSQPPDAMRVLTVGGQTLTADAGGLYKVSGQVLTSGGTIVVAGTTYGLAPSGSALFVDGTISAQAAPTTEPAFVLDGQSYAAMTSDSVTGYVLGPGTTLLPGGPAITVSGTVLSLPAAGTAAPYVLIDGVTSSFAVDSASPTTPPVLTVGTRTYTPVVSGSTTYYSIAPGVTLTPGGVVTVDGTRVSLGPEGTVAVVGTSTATLVPASLTASTTGSGVGGYVASGLGYTGPAATGGAGRYAECPTAWLESCVMGMIGWCLWFV